MGNCPRRLLISVVIEPENEPEPSEPATEREGAASAADYDSDGGFSLVLGEPPVAAAPKPKARPFFRDASHRTTPHLFEPAPHMKLHRTAPHQVGGGLEQHRTAPHQGAL